MNAYFIRALYGKYTDVFRNNGFAALGWIEDENLDLHNYEDLESYYKREFPTDQINRRGQNLGQIWRFCNEIKPDDIIISTYPDATLIIGRAKGQAYYKKNDLCELSLRLEVDWNKKTFSRSQLSVPAQNTIKSTLSVFKVKQVEEFARLAGYIYTTDSKIIDKVYDFENNINAIKAQLLKLSADEFEMFVSYILQSLGFEPTQSTGKTGDGGVDFEGNLDVLSVANIKLQVQVKRYENSTIGEKQIREFRGALKTGYQGTFITLSDFNKKAIESSDDKQRTQINLIDGKRLIEIFIEQYDKVMELIEEENNESMIDKLKFRKSIFPE